MEKKTWQVLGGIAALGLGIYLYSKYRKNKTSYSSNSESETINVQESEYSNVIGYGSKGEDVLVLQKYLNTISKNNIPETGEFDDMTLKITKQFLNSEYVDLPTLKRIKRDLKTAKLI